MHAACLSSAARNKQEGRKRMTLRIESGLADRQLGNGMVVMIRSVKPGVSRGERERCFLGGILPGCVPDSGWLMGRWQRRLTVRVVLPGKPCPLAGFQKKWNGWCSEG